MDIPVEDFPSDTLHGWFVMIDQLFLHRNIHDIRTRKIIEALEIRKHENVMNGCVGRTLNLD